MFGIAPSELMVVALAAIVFIGPKDLPRAMRLAGRWIGRGRAMTRQARGMLDEIVRQAELEARRPDVPGPSAAEPQKQA